MRNTGSFIPPINSGAAHRGRVREVAHALCLTSAQCDRIEHKAARRIQEPQQHHAGRQHRGGEAGDQARVEIGDEKRHADSRRKQSARKKDCAKKRKRSLFLNKIKDAPTDSNTVTKGTQLAN